MEGTQHLGVQAAMARPRVGTVCNLEIDDDLKLVIEFMQSNLPASKLVGLAKAAAALAPILWGRDEREDVRALVLCEPPVS